MVSGILKIDLAILRRENIVPGYIALSEEYGYLITEIYETPEKYSVLKYCFINLKPSQYPDILENALIETPEHSWPDLRGGFTFVKGPYDTDLGIDEGSDELVHVKRNEILILFDPFEPFYEVIPLLHFYQVLLLLSEKILELAREYGTVAYYQKVEPQHYSPNWEQEMERLIGLLRERIAEESTRED